MTYASLWTALYHVPRPDGWDTCHWIKWGHAKGQPISRETVERLARRFAKAKGWQLLGVYPGGPRLNAFI